MSSSFALSSSQIRRYYREFISIAQLSESRRGNPLISRFDLERIYTAYRYEILGGNIAAIWSWYAFEANFMVEAKEDLMDLQEINLMHLGEAQSISFFESLLLYRNLFERPLGPLSLVENCSRIQAHRIPVWIVQGSGDLVCPVANAEAIVNFFRGCDCLQNYFEIEGANHLQSNEKITKALAECFSEAHALLRPSLHMSPASSPEK